jgi:hypothetical protein
MLKYLYCNDNKLTLLDLSKTPLLIDLYCQNNRLSNLTTSGLEDLRVLLCGGNLFTSLDLSDNYYLGMGVYVGIPYFLSLDNMPGLEKVCVWSVPFPYPGFRVNTDGSPNIQFSTECIN